MGFFMSLFPAFSLRNSGGTQKPERISVSKGNKFGCSNASKLLLLLGLYTYLIFLIFSNHYSNSKFFWLGTAQPESSPTNFNHVVFGLLGSVKVCHQRRHYLESWWRPNVTRGFLYLDQSPTGVLVPWPHVLPPYRVSDNLTESLHEIKPQSSNVIRMVHGITKLMRETDGTNLRWVVMGDDDTIFFVENVIDVVRAFDHTKYHYIGGLSEFVMANYWFSFNQGFGGGGFMLSYPLAKALANNIEHCLRRYPWMHDSDYITKVCVADIGVNLSPHKGFHQIDMHGDISGFLSSHPKTPLLSLHHLDMVEPIFPDMDRYEAIRHLMKAAASDQSRLLQQTICHHMQNNWSLSISWGYSAHIYEEILTRNHLQRPLETFQPWSTAPQSPPLYMFHTRLPSNDSCRNPHVFFFKEVNMVEMGILTTYSRAAPRQVPPCSLIKADFVSEIRVISPPTKRKEMDRCECCNVIAVDGTYVELKFRECMINEVIA